MAARLKPVVIRMGLWIEFLDIEMPIIIIIIIIKRSLVSPLLDVLFFFHPEYC